jgi:hypothetical protein
VAQEGAKKKSRSDDSRVANGMPLQVGFPDPHSTCDHLLERRAATNSPETWICADGGLGPGQPMATQSRRHTADAIDRDAAVRSEAVGSAPTIATVIVSLALVAGLASYLPARRARSARWWTRSSPTTPGSCQFRSKSAATACASGGNDHATHESRSSALDEIQFVS